MITKGTPQYTEAQKMANQNTMKILKTKGYYFGVQVKGDGTLCITAEYQHVGNGKWINCHSRQWEGAEALIGSMGGKEQLLARCIEVEHLDELVNERNEANQEYRKKQAASDAAKEAARTARVEQEYKDAFGDGSQETESTLENIAILLRYLNSMNWGVWHLPTMTIGYACHQYDCDGKIASTIKLDEPVEGYTMLQYGAPRGHLTAYTNVEKAILNREGGDDE